MCKIKIDSAKPDILRDGEFGYKIKRWIVKGKVLSDDCGCKDKKFDLYIDSNKLKLSRASIEGMVKVKLKL